MKLFSPERVFFEPTSLKYPLGQKLLEYFSARDIEIIKAPIQKVLQSIPGETENHKYAHAKKTLVITTKKHLILTYASLQQIMNFHLLPTVLEIVNTATFIQLNRSSPT